MTPTLYENGELTAADEEWLFQTDERRVGWFIHTREENAKKNLSYL